MADFSMITPRLATGAAISTSEDVSQLVAAGVTHILDCREEFDDGPLLASAGVIYQWNPTADDGQPKPDIWWKLNLSFALTAYVQLDTCIYAHCAAGINRGPSAAYGIIRACWGLEDKDTIALIKTARPQAGIAYASDFERFWAANPPTNPSVPIV